MSVFYINANLASTTGDPAPLAKTLSFNSPVIPAQGAYVVGVSRLTLPLYNVPMWIPTLKIGGDGFETIYSITFAQNAATSGPVFLRVNPYDTQQVPPATPLADQPSTSWAFVMDVAAVVDMLNVASVTALASLKTAGGDVPDGMTAVWGWNAATQLFTLSLSPYENWVDGSTTGTPTAIYFGASFAPYLAGWQTSVDNSYPSRSAANSYLDIRLVVSPATATAASATFDAPADPTTSAWLPLPGLADTPFVPRDPSTAVFTITQQFQAAYVFNALSTIQIIATGITTVPEIVQPELTDGDTASIPQSALSAILTDFAPDLAAAGNNTATVVYNAASQIPGMRFIELLGGAPLQTLTLAALWTDQHGAVRQLYSARESQAAHIKLCFAPRVLAGLPPRA